uniref:maltotransferase domain-containing protein n=1 Tax=Actinoplanes sp. RD1 TaxID=3064538 RepID=UPI0027407157
IAVLDVAPVVDGGARPAKSVVGEEFQVTATVPAPEQEVFRRAGSHPGRTFGTGAAAALAGTDERTVAAALERLVDAHLVETPAPGLFRLHDLLRLFATENLTAAEHRECLSRLLAWLTGHADPRERDNAIAAAHQGLALGLHEQVWDLVLATLPTLRRVSDHADRLTLWTAAAEAAKALGDDSRRARALHWVSWGYGMAGLAGPALAAAEEAVALAGPGTLAAALFSQGRALRVVRRYAEAEAALRRALDLYEQAGAADDADEVRITLGLVCNVSGRPGEAIEWVRGVRRPWALSTLSVAYKLSGRPAEAAALNDRVIATARQDNDAYLLAYAVRERGLLALDAHRLADARRDLCDALTMLESFPDQMGVCGVHANLGALAVAEGHPAEALLEYATAGEAYERLGHRAAAGESHLRRAEILDDLGRPTEAAQERARARELL